MVKVNEPRRLKGGRKGGKGKGRKDERKRERLEEKINVRNILPILCNSAFFNMFKFL